MPINPNEITWDGPSSDEGIVWDSPQQPKNRGKKTSINAQTIQQARNAGYSDSDIKQYIQMP